VYYQHEGFVKLESVSLQLIYPVASILSGMIANKG